MTQIEKMELFIRAMKGEVEIQTSNAKYAKDLWWSLHWKDKITKFVVITQQWSIEELLQDFMEIRIVKSLPLLSDADADFAEKYLPHDWWIARDKIGILLIYSEKPIKRDLAYEWKNGNINNVSFTTFPKFESIKWGNDDCYTIKELLDNYHERKKETKNG